MHIKQYSKGLSQGLYNVIFRALKDIEYIVLKLNLTTSRDYGLLSLLMKFSDVLVKMYVDALTYVWYNSLKTPCVTSGDANHYVDPRNNKMSCSCIVKIKGECESMNYTIPTLR